MPVCVHMCVCVNVEEIRLFSPCSSQSGMTPLKRKKGK